MKWALPVPMHLDPNDRSPEADEIRLHLFQQFFQRTGGRGFRIPPGTSPKRKNPRRGSATRAITNPRIDAIFLNVKYGERTNG